MLLLDMVPIASRMEERKMSGRTPERSQQRTVSDANRETVCGNLPSLGCPQLSCLVSVAPPFRLHSMSRLNRISPRNSGIEMEDPIFATQDACQVLKARVTVIPKTIDVRRVFPKATLCPILAHSHLLIVCS
jgi:hypothetical protein